MRNSFPIRWRPILLVWLFALAGCTPLIDPNQLPAAQQPGNRDDPTQGASGLGDPYYPRLGNGGYDVLHYTIVLDVQPMTNRISGTTTLTALATQLLSAFNLDFAGLTIDHVFVNDSAADYKQEGRELTITPANPLPRNHEFTVVVTHRGSPQPIWSAVVTREVGWFHTEDGAINVVSEPDGAASWFPSNNHPRDKATYRFEITVPAEFVVAASGLLRNTVKQGEKIRYIWQMDKPMASYLAAINIDNYVVETTPGPDGVVIRNYFPPKFPESKRQEYDKLPEVVAFLSERFGAYPFTAYGVLIADPESEACQGIVALEIQTLSTHCLGSDLDEEIVIVHELAHQWFGNSVSLQNWQDVWLKEGLATYAEWLWQTRGKKLDVLSKIADIHRRRLSLTTPIGQPAADELYSDAAYSGGALVFHALRLHVGDEIFFQILHTYAERFQYRNASTQDFIALAEEMSDQDLDEFFQTWLFSEEIPRLPATTAGE